MYSHLGSGLGDHEAGDSMKKTLLGSLFRCQSQSNSFAFLPSLAGSPFLLFALGLIQKVGKTAARTLTLFHL